MCNPLHDMDEPEDCATCGARRQWNVDGEIVHARAGTYECPATPLSDTPLGLLFIELEPEPAFCDTITGLPYYRRVKSI